MSGNKMALDALKPCPFCGGDVMHRHALWPSDGDTDSVIHAQGSTCGMGCFSIGTADQGVSVAAAWNARAAIAALQAEPQPAIPEGWGFSSADFSLQASGVSEYGGVMLIRTGADRADWHFLTDEQREVIPLYVSGTGRTVAEAIASAAKNCTPLPATPPKD